MVGKKGYSMDLVATSHGYIEEHEGGKDAASQKEALVDAVRVNMQEGYGASGGPGFSADTVLDVAQHLYRNWKATSGGIGAFNLLLGGQGTLS